MLRFNHNESRCKFSFYLLYLGLILSLAFIDLCFLSDLKKIIVIISWNIAYPSYYLFSLLGTLVKHALNSLILFSPSCKAFFYIFHLFYAGFFVSSFFLIYWVTLANKTIWISSVQDLILHCVPITQSQINFHYHILSLLHLPCVILFPSNLLLFSSAVPNLLFNSFTDSLISTILFLILKYLF